MKVVEVRLPRRRRALTRVRSDSSLKEVYHRFFFGAESPDLPRRFLLLNPPAGNDCERRQATRGEGGAGT